MPGESYMAPRNPLAVAKLDGKTFVQLTIWVLVILAAWALGKFLFGQATSKAKQLTGSVTTSGSSNPFFG